MIKLIKVNETKGNNMCFWWGGWVTTPSTSFLLFRSRDSISQKIIAVIFFPFKKYLFLFFKTDFSQLSVDTDYVVGVLKKFPE